jgi:hypothetical protein
MSVRGLQIARNIAKNIGIEGTITNSRKKGKRFDIKLENGKTISFGSWPFTGDGTYSLEHGDKRIRRNWKARHRKILKDGKPAYKNPDSPEFYSWRILWT